MSNNSKFIRQRFGPKMIGCFQGIIVIIVIVKHHPLISFFAGYWSIIRWRSYCYLFGYSLMISKGVPWISNVLCALDVFDLMAADVERSFIFFYCLTSKDKFLAKFTLDDNLILNTSSKTWKLSLLIFNQNSFHNDKKKNWSILQVSKAL